ncbi:hypothetical protein F5Y18DRAFT_34114 [Xylariaceae sp. FL1019]|nr:hypothetical protein F5Y18DRAFT_34114 [Xylariaceae sp. FL1019]
MRFLLALERDLIAAQFHLNNSTKRGSVRDHIVDGSSHGSHVAEDFGEAIDPRALQIKKYDDRPTTPSPIDPAPATPTPPIAYNHHLPMPSPTVDGFGCRDLDNPAGDFYLSQLSSVLGSPSPSTPAVKTPVLLTTARQIEGQRHHALPTPGQTAPHDQRQFAPGRKAHSGGITKTQKSRTTQASRRLQRGVGLTGKEPMTPVGRPMPMPSPARAPGQ